MQTIIFIGIQASGKSSFYKSHFFNSHVRISMDLLNTRNKEAAFLDTCFHYQTAFVVDNTNPSKQDRAKYIELAKKNKYEIVGYYFSSSIKDSLERNKLRTGKDQIPEIGIKSCYKRLETPSWNEGFDKLYYVQIAKDGFIIKDWKDEI